MSVEDNLFFMLFSVRNGEMLERFREPRTFGELREFVMRLRYSASQGGSATEQETPAVLVLDRDNFHDWTDNAGLVFILFHADWSRHCKALTPTWESLAENYRREESIMVASIDCNAADNVNKELCRKTKEEICSYCRDPLVVSCKPDDPVPTAGRAGTTGRPTFRPIRYVGTSYPTRYDSSERRWPVFAQ